jgi:hypothetical protein
MVQNSHPNDCRRGGLLPSKAVEPDSITIPWQPCCWRWSDLTTHAGLNRPYVLGTLNSSTIYSLLSTACFERFVILADKGAIGESVLLRVSGSDAAGMLIRHRCHWRASGEHNTPLVSLADGRACDPLIPSHQAHGPALWQGKQTRRGGRLVSPPSPADLT